MESTSKQDGLWNTWRNDPSLQDGPWKTWRQGLESSQSASADDQPAGLTGALKSGLEQTGRNLGTAANVYADNREHVVKAANDAAKQQRTPEATAFSDQIARNKEEAKAAGKDDWWQGIKNVSRAVVAEPKGALHTIVEQAPNAGVVLGTGAAGAATGGAIGSIVPVIGTGIGATIGFGLGMFGGNTLIETGAKGLEAAQDQQFTPEERNQVMKEGAIKGGVITAVDMATMGGTKFITGAGRRALFQAEAATLRKHGIDATNRAAVEAAKADAKIATEVQQAQQHALAMTNTLAKRAGRGTAAIGLESIGEGVGEYLGEYAATGEADKTEAVLEGLLSLGQSAFEAGGTALLNRRQSQGQTWKGPTTRAAEASEEPAGYLHAPGETGMTPEQVRQRKVEQAQSMAEAEQHARELYRQREEVEQAQQPWEEMKGVDAGYDPARRLRNQVPPPQGSFSQVEDFADLLNEERTDIDQRRQSLSERQRQIAEAREAFAFEEADRRTTEGMQREAIERRRAVLASVLSDPETSNPAQRFTTELQRQGFREAAPSEDELATIQRFEDIRNVEAAPAIEPSAPNELNPAALGIKERVERVPVRMSNPRRSMAAAEKVAAYNQRRLGGEWVAMPHPEKEGMYVAALMSESAPAESVQSMQEQPIQQSGLILPKRQSRPMKSEAMARTWQKRNTKRTGEPWTIATRDDGLYVLVPTAELQALNPGVESNVRNTDQQSDALPAARSTASADYDVAGSRSALEPLSDDISGLSAGANAERTSSGSVESAVAGLRGSGQQTVAGGPAPTRAASLPQRGEGSTITAPSAEPARSVGTALQGDNQTIVNSGESQTEEAGGPASIRVAANTRANDSGSTSTPYAGPGNSLQTLSQSGNQTLINFGDGQKVKAAGSVPDSTNTTSNKKVKEILPRKGTEPERSIKVVKSNIKSDAVGSFADEKKSTASFTPSGHPRLDQALRILLESTSGNGSPDGLLGKEHMQARKQIASILRGEPAGLLNSGVKQVEALLHEAAGIKAKSLEERRAQFIDFIDRLTGQQAPSTEGQQYSRTGRHDPLAAAAMPRQATNFNEARLQARSFLGAPLKNAVSGMVATVSRNNLDKMLSLSAVKKSTSPTDQALAVANLDHLFANAEYGWSKPDRDSDVNITAIHRFFSAMDTLRAGQSS